MFFLQKSLVINNKHKKKVLILTENNDLINDENEKNKLIDKKNDTLSENEKSNLKSDKKFFLKPKVLLKSGIQFGHKVEKKHVNASWYIYGVKNNIHIIDLSKILKNLIQAIGFVYDLAKANKTILFVGTKKQAKDAVRIEAERCKMPYVSEKWIGGTLTNFSVIQKSIFRLAKLETKYKKNMFYYLNKKELKKIKNEIKKLTIKFFGLRNLSALPDAIFLCDPLLNKNTIIEAKKKNIPIIAISDTNVNPDDFHIAIPGNDDGIKSNRIVCALIADAVAAAKGEPFSVLGHDNAELIFDRETKELNFSYENEEKKDEIFSSKKKFDDSTKEINLEKAE
ncbi:30S ribosomal protein S2 [symbiont of Argiope bruennichi]|uniref:30S ribosomal protein S2 n=1 Tax=symbiont of Argiope bruennichi TaxID=2810479 RepID=UPI003DA200F8